MSGWPRYTASELSVRGVLRVEDGNHGEYRPRSTEFVEHGVAYIRAADMSPRGIEFRGASKISNVAVQRITKGIGKPYDVLLSHKGTVGKIAVAPRDAPPFVCSPQTTFWRSLDSGVLDARFLAYYMSSPDFVRQLDSRKGETDMAAYVSLTEQRKLTVVLPPVGVQQRIAATLGGLDDKIQSNRRAIALSRKLARALYIQARRGTTSSVAVADVVTFHNNRRVPLSLQERQALPGEVPYYGATGVFGHVAKALFDQTLLLVGEDGSVVQQNGFPVTQYVWGPAWVNNHAHVLTGKGISTEVAVLALERADVRPLVTGAVQAKLSMGNLKRLRVSVPHGRALQYLQEAVDPLFAIVRQRSDESRRLMALRDALLPELLSGRIRVPEAREAVDHVLA